jgi:hypothetical protein
MAPSQAWLKGIWNASERRGASQLTMQQINAEIATVRQVIRKKKTH